ncbi:FAD/NAD(P)-binding domain-containing protein [Morchella conica CCBAS932]|uniref:FAD/NAD(P)-binding domain-containing protein n=1 Tax=Morchella conica CCBAS932 TaxID=1392247 RepID=A0A3N4KWZ4_9PEZI|nr:FAD/NAD(P)-binding domain-containing protein [Morchella conica CCBAS932]
MENPPAYSERSFLINNEHKANRPPSSIIFSDDGLYPDLTPNLNEWAGHRHPKRRIIVRKTESRDWTTYPGPIIQICSLAAFFYFLLFCGVLSLCLVVGLRPRADPPYVRKVAIIGAGPAGASAAYNIRKYARHHGILVDITIFEKDSHIGGRSTRHISLSDEDGDTVQISATGFHESNQNLVQITKEVGLKPVWLDGRVDTDLSGRSGERWGVFDGNSIVFRQAHPTNFLTGWWWSFKLFYFYGYSPRYTRDTAQDTLSKFSRVYTSFFPFESLPELVKDLELEEEITSTGSQLLTAHGVSDAFQRELVNAWARRDFAQNLGTMSGLAAVTAFDDGGDMTVQGGHWSLFETMIDRSNVDLRLNAAVFGLRRMDWGGWVVASQPAHGDNDPEDGDYTEFDSVILTAPWQFSELDIKGEPLENVPANREYAGLHITLFKSPRMLSGGYFNYNGEVPETLLTTLRDFEFKDMNSKTGVEGVGSVGFYEIKSVKRSDRVDMMGVVITEWLYKLVSPAKIEDSTIKAMLGAGEDEDGIISWIDRHEWPAAIPYVYPKTQSTPLPPLKLSPNFYYTSAIESLGSTMELSSLMGANIATLVVNEWWKEGRGKRPVRNFNEPAGKNSHDTQTLWPETAYSWGRGVYEGIWRDVLHNSGQEKVMESEEAEVLNESEEVEISTESEEQKQEAAE